MPALRLGSCRQGGRQRKAPPGAFSNRLVLLVAIMSLAPLGPALSSPSGLWRDWGGGCRLPPVPLPACVRTRDVIASSDDPLEGAGGTMRGTRVPVCAIPKGYHQKGEVRERQGIITMMASKRQTNHKPIPSKQYVRTGNNHAGILFFSKLRGVFFGRGHPLLSRRGL